MCTIFNVYIFKWWFVIMKHRNELLEHIKNSCGSHNQLCQSEDAVQPAHCLSISIYFLQLTAILFVVEWFNSIRFASGAIHFCCILLWQALLTSKSTCIINTTCPLQPFSTTLMFGQEVGRTDQSERASLSLFSQPTTAILSTRQPITVLHQWHHLEGTFEVHYIISI